MYLHINEDKKFIWDNVNEINEDFFSKLQLEFPKLSKSDIELCSLVHLNLSNKEIAVIKGYEAESAKKAKSRLKKKLNLNLDDDLKTFLGKFGA